ncbi:hypothetical protein G6F63_016140 [Rhizopus arrhizus]|nr:hypothetical protein G6F63_016140 [Rhizopus arrhizus]
MVGLGLGLTAENPARKLAVDIVAKRRKPDKLRTSRIRDRCPRGQFHAGGSAGGRFAVSAEPHPPNTGKQLGDSASDAHDPQRVTDRGR